MEMVVLLYDIIILFIVTTKGNGYDCQNRSALQQINYNGITTSKTNNHYQVRAGLCLSTDKCFFSNKANIIECDQICGACKKIMSDEECTSNRACEQIVDTFLNDYYINATFSYCTDFLLTSTQATENVITTTKPAAITTTITECCTCNQGIETNTQISTTILGVFTGLLVVALSIVTTGWLWTCWVFRRRIDNSKQNCSSSEDERSYTNPTYGETTESLPTTVTATYDVVDPNSQSTTAVVDDGQMYNVLNRSQPEGYTDVSNTANVCTTGDYSHLDFDLQKPKDDYEDPDNGYGLTEYEVPQTLNKT